MKAVIGIMGFPKTITIARKVAGAYAGKASFIYITSALDDSISVIQQREREGLDILIAGPGNSQLLREYLKIPVVPFFRHHPHAPEGVEGSARHLGRHRHGAFRKRTIRSEVF